MKRVMCVDDSGCPELKFGEPYHAENYCSDCGKGGYQLHEISIVAPEKISGIRSCRCGDCLKIQPETPFNIRKNYRENRFIDIDEEAEKIEVTNEEYATTTV